MEITSPIFHNMKFLLSVSLLAITPLFTSCSSVEGVRISNATTGEITVKAYFKSASNEQANGGDIRNNENNISFSLNIGSSDIWQYETEGKSRKTIDQTFLLLVIENKKGCSAEFNREEIEEKATKNGLWNLIIQTGELTCP